MHFPRPVDHVTRLQGRTSIERLHHHEIAASTVRRTGRDEQPRPGPHPLEAHPCTEVDRQRAAQIDVGLLIAAIYVVINATLSRLAVALEARQRGRLSAG